MTQKLKDLSKMEKALFVMKTIFLLIFEQELVMELQTIGVDGPPVDKMYSIITQVDLFKS